ncbi:arylsulfatase [Persicitalea jodogahamensis]|uniref:Arylsulfatase n=1 Tax=Persicitalea jodogahamensis TaxID=402147 RepID=A0A8J3D5M1_9BACT|nr:arylsulfatase [Persicitalea jodogahamensis]GHB86532.1 arylsulfatase [Persicitalea jodogahamensis]
MKYFSFKDLVGFALLGFLFSCYTNPVERSSEPNIVVILADDMGYSDIGCFGSEIQTPNLDRLASGGVRLSSFYNNARCCPSRAALLTGLYPQQAGVGGMTDINVTIPEYQGYFNNHTITIADLLRQEGYSTYLAGKWHVGEEKEHWPLQHGFDRCFSLIQGAASYFDFLPYRNEKWPPGNQLTVVRNNTPLDLKDSAFYATDLYTNEAINMLNSHDKQKPFFLYLAYTAPHWPLHALPEDIARYENTYLAGWEAIRSSRYKRLKEIGLIGQSIRLSERNPAEPVWNRLTGDEKRKQAHLMAVYAAMIDRMDRNIGRLLLHLKKKGQLDNTAIFFLSDNGGSTAGSLTGGKYGHPRFSADALPGTPESLTGYGKSWANVSNTPFRYFKTDTYEGGIASPFIAWYPGRFRKNQIVEDAAHIVDIMPTLADLAGTRYPENHNNVALRPLEGNSLLGVLSGKAGLPDRPLFFEHMSNSGVIEGEWKLVRSRDQPWELYNLQKDRSETNNLAREFPDQLGRLTKKYEQWATKNNVLPWQKVEDAIPYKF